MRTATLILLAALMPWPALGQAKMARCLKPAEVKVEQLVRHGIFLRESGTRCDEYKAGTAKLWTEFDTKFGARFAKQTETRRKMFEREFKVKGPDQSKAAEVIAYFDGRLVTFYRHYPLGIAYCENVNKLLTEVTKKGWGAFVTQAETIQNEVMMDFKICP